MWLTKIKGLISNNNATNKRHNSLPSLNIMKLKKKKKKKGFAFGAKKPNKTPLNLNITPIMSTNNDSNDDISDLSDIN